MNVRPWTRHRTGSGARHGKVSSIQMGVVTAGLTVLCTSEHPGLLWLDGPDGAGGTGASLPPTGHSVPGQAQGLGRPALLPSLLLGTIKFTERLSVAGTQRHTHWAFRYTHTRHSHTIGRGCPLHWRDEENKAQSSW